jgi:hypothetical protein
MGRDFGVLLLALLAIGCSENKTDDPKPCPEVPCAKTEASIAVGTSTPDAFVPFVDGDVVTLDFGPQGGQHFYADVLLESALPGQWHLSFTFADGSGQTAAYNEKHVKTCPCDTLVRRVAVIMQQPQATEGVLSVSGADDQGQSVASVPVALKVAN